MKSGRALAAKITDIDRQQQQTQQREIGEELGCSQQCHRRSGGDASAQQGVTPGIMHMETDLLDSIDEVRTGEGEVLQSAGQTPVGSRISHRITQISRQLRLSVDRSGADRKSVV